MAVRSTTLLTVVALSCLVVSAQHPPASRWKVLGTVRKCSRSLLLPPSSVFPSTCTCWVRHTHTRSRTYCTCSTLPCLL
ncbi:hypothetical protein GGS20DRAFT_435663 [Poronia punctata]|nr:hypothetical protein GGS20DRAFT_435663 [Poronia punctata]